SFSIPPPPRATWYPYTTLFRPRHHFKGRIWIEGEGKFGAVSQWKSEGEKIAEALEGNWFHKAIKRHEHDRELSFDIVEEAKQLSELESTGVNSSHLRRAHGVGG